MTTIRVRAVAKGGVPRRRIGEVFDAPADPADPRRPRADYAPWVEVVADEAVAEPTGEKKLAPKRGGGFRVRKGEVVAERDLGRSGGGWPADGEVEDLA